MEKGKERRTSHSGRSAIYIRNGGAGYSGTDFLMLGIRIVSSVNASLLGNFEIVATTLIALLLFKEKVSGKLWISILFITVSSIILSFEGSGSFQFSMGSLCFTCYGVLWNRLLSDCNYHRRIIAKDNVYRFGNDSWIRSIWSEYFPVYQSPAQSGFILYDNRHSICSCGHTDVSAYDTLMFRYYAARVKN